MPNAGREHCICHSRCCGKRVCSIPKASLLGMPSSYHLRETIEERHRQAKLFWDLTGFHSPNFNLVTHQVVFVGLAYTLLQMQLVQENRPELNRMTKNTLNHQMLPYGNHIIVYTQNYYGFFDLPEYTEIIMGITEPSKTKLLKKVRKIRREFLSSLSRPRGP